MRRLTRAIIWAPIALLAASLGRTAEACFDHTSGAVQARAASGSQNSTVECGSPPVEVTNSLSSGGTYWTGTGRGLLGLNETDYTFHLEYGWWGFSVRTLAGFQLPGLIITGGPGPTVDVAVNVAFGGAASGYVPASQNVRFDVQLWDPSGNGIGSGVNSTVSYVPNGPEQFATSPLILNVPVGTPFTLELTTTWFTEGPPFGSGLTTYGYGYVALLSTEVFALPPGYTVDAVSAGIVDNQIPQVSPVPSLAHGPRIALGLLLVACGVRLGKGRRVRA